MNIFKIFCAGFLTVLILWGVAASYAMATCIDDGPPLDRSHNVYSVGSKSSGSKSSPLSVQTYDLVSMVLPRGRADDWQVETIEPSPGQVRALSPQELEKVLITKRFITYTDPVRGYLLKSASPLLHFGMMRPGKVALRIKRIAGKERYNLYLNIVPRPPVEQKKSLPGRKGDPEPSC